MCVCVSIYVYCTCITNRYVKIDTDVLYLLAVMYLFMEQYKYILMYYSVRTQVLCMYSVHYDDELIIQY